MNARIEKEIKSRRDQDYIIRCTKQDGNDGKERYEQQLLSPEMPGARDEGQCFGTMMQRMHRPQGRHQMLGTVDKISDDIGRKHIDNQRNDEPPAVGT